MGKKGADLADAILQNCERDYATLEQVFVGLTPEGLPFIVQITSDNTGASHSSCMGTDTDYNSIGCSVLFLNWLRFQLTHTWADIVAAGGATLAATYKNLTGKTTGWHDFETVIIAHFPVGQQYHLGTDNPFPL